MEGEAEFSPFGKVLYRATERCPICGNTSLEVLELLYQVPFFGNLILYSYTCHLCGYRHVDIQYLEEKKWRVVKYVVEDERDVVETLVFRSKTCSIYSPELGFSIDPGIMSEAFITTVEGLLYRVLDYADRMMVLYESATDKIEEFKRKVEKALQGRLNFTVVLEDPLGNSIIKPPRGREGRVVLESLITPSEI